MIVYTYTYPLRYPPSTLAFSVYVYLLIASRFDTPTNTYGMKVTRATLLSTVRDNRQRPVVAPEMLDNT